MTHPDPAATIDLHSILRSHCGDFLTALETHLQGTVPQPEKLPHLLFPDVQPHRADEISAVYFAVGLHIGKVLTRSRDWEGDFLQHVLAAVRQVADEALGDGR
ncbi:hypothetical protein ACFV3R_25560 [Streptomyces sp. NPDC059740]|uniref:hypothetical protein n=1 Tax=Streptomyces sp. NPDC059740 TaxID=3346926 RepID=UPI0036563C0F